MAWSVVVNKKNVSKMDHPDGNRYVVTLEMILSKDGTAVLTESLSEVYVYGESTATTIGRFKASMQALIDGFKISDTIFNSAGMNTAVSTLQSQLVT